MNITKHILILSFVIMAQSFPLFAQENNDTKTIQPKVMVIPFTKSNQSIITVFDNNNLNRISISKIKESFDNRNFPTVDFSSKRKIIENERVMEMENQKSLKQQLIEISGADIYVEVETTVNRSSGGNSVTIICSAFDAFTGVSLANKSGVSNRFHTNSFEKLVHVLVDEMSDDFINNLQASFDDINENGRLIAMNIGFAESSEYNMDYEFEDLEMLSDLIESWLDENAYKSYFHVQGVTATKMMIDELRIPLRDNKGKNYRISKFVNKFRKFLKSKGITSSRDIQGGKIYITIN